MEELIAKYFENTISEDEKKELERLLVEDTAFKQEFEFQNALKNAIAVSERQKLKMALKGFENTKSFGHRIKRFYPYAAVLVLCVVLFLFFNKTPNAQQLYTTYFEMYPNVVEPISRSSGKKSLKQLAFESYELGDYEKALVNFNSYKAEEPSSTAVINLYLANIYLDNGNAEKAITVLKDNLNTTTYWQDKNLWYLSLAYLNLGDLNMAKKTLSLLAKQPSNFKKQETLALLDALE